MGYQQVVGSFLAIIGIYVAYELAKIVYNQWTSPLNDIPGPPSSSRMYGNMKEIWGADHSVVLEKWIQEYGLTMKCKAFLSLNRLYTVDVKAINHILMNTTIYQKPEISRYLLSQVMGNGVLVVEGDKHKQQRKVMNPAFGAAQIRELTEIFIEKSVQLRDIWAIESKEGVNGRVEVLYGLTKMTLDVIGLAGFHYNFDALTRSSSEKNELDEAFSTILRSGDSLPLLLILQALFPAFRFFLEGYAETRAASKTLARMGDQLLRDSKAGLMADEGQAGRLEKESFKRRDLLSLLVRANVSTDLPSIQRMTDKDVLAQVPTFLVAGHETTSTGTTWALFALTQNLEAQTKLRNELLTVGTDNPTMDELNALPYLDAVVRESLRVHPPVPSTTREATQDDILPLGKPIRDKHGNILDKLRIRKGDTIIVPILALNHAKSIWGEDASEFRPERWQDIPDAASTIPGVWGNMMTFLGGPRACIGYRFSLVEMKALLFTLVRAFEFELAVAPSDVDMETDVVRRPLLKSDRKAGNQMPLIIKPISPNQQ